MNKHLKNYIWFILFVIFSTFSYFTGFTPGMAIDSNFNLFFIEIVSFLPFIFILIGLFDAWFPKEIIEKHVGRESGIKGILLVIFLAMLQAGPLYGAFPVAYILHKKGASVRNIFIYLGAFSSMKLPMLGIEIAYLGAKFSFLKTLVSLPLFIFTAYLMEKLIGRDFKITDETD